MDRDEENFTYVVNGNNDKAFKLLRADSGELQIEVNRRIRDKTAPKLVYVDALDVVDQVTAAMSQQERLLAYARLAEKLNKS